MVSLLAFCLFALTADGAPGTTVPPVIGTLEEVRGDSHRAPAAAAGHGPHDAVVQPSPAEVLERLKAGNERFAADMPKHPHCDPNWRKRTFREGQHPFAVVVSCSDSRVPVELVLDQGLGDLFVIRVAGNVVADHEMASIEYAAEHMGVPLVLILGHRECGAVTAVVKHAKERGHIPHLVEHIQPAVAQVEHDSPGIGGAARVAAAVQQNVWHSIEDLLTESVMVRERVETKRLMVVGGVYDLDSGRIIWLGEHVRQAELLHAKKSAR